MHIEEKIIKIKNKTKKIKTTTKVHWVSHGSGEAGETDILLYSIFPVILWTSIR